jgi:hypothetical protein
LIPRFQLVFEYFFGVSLESWARELLHNVAVVDPALLFKLLLNSLLFTNQLIKIDIDDF